MGGSAPVARIARWLRAVNKLAPHPYEYDLCENSKYTRNIVGPQGTAQLFPMIATPLFCPFTPLVCSNNNKIHYLHYVIIYLSFSFSLTFLHPIYYNYTPTYY